MTARDIWPFCDAIQTPCLRHLSRGSQNTHNYSIFWIIILFVVGVSSPVVGGENELLSKEEWSIVQSVEYRYRESLSEGHLLLLEHSGKHLAGILSTQGEQRLWILLDPDHRPFLKQIPKGDYHISSDEFIKITRFGKVHHEVQSVLTKSIQSVPDSK